MTTTKLILTLALASSVSYGAHITTDASFTLGSAVIGTSSGNSQVNPIVWNYCAWQPLWQLNPNPWGVNPDAKGSITMTYSGKGSIVTNVNLSNLVSSGVNAYPFIFYGSDPFGDRIKGQPVEFPAQLSSMSSLFLDVNYSLAVNGTAPGDLNVAFDEWLVPSANYVGGLGGSVEVMVAPYFKFSWPPAGQYIGTITELVVVNGVPMSLVFNEYSTGVGPGHEVLFFPRDTQIASGDVRLNLLDFMKIAAATAGINSNWYLSGIEFGSEFGHTSAANYTLTTNKLEIDQTLTSGN